MFSITHIESARIISAYLDLSCNSDDEATLSFTLGDSTLNQWKIKVSFNSIIKLLSGLKESKLFCLEVTQLSCNDDSVASQQGCFQYHTGVTGTIQSYNVAGQIQLAAQNYKNCIRQEAGYCCIEFIPTIFKLGPTACAAAATRCASVSSCSQDYILIPEVQNPSGTDNSGSYDRYFMYS